MKRIRAITVAAILGAVVFNAVIWIANSLDAMPHRGAFLDYVDIAFGLLSFAEAILLAFVEHVIGFSDTGNRFMDLLVVGSVGAFIFAFITILWQFTIKRGHDHKRPVAS